MSTSEVRKQGFLVKKVSPCSYEGTKLGFKFYYGHVFLLDLCGLAGTHKILHQMYCLLRYPRLSRLDYQQIVCCNCG